MSSIFAKMCYEAMRGMTREVNQNTLLAHLWCATESHIANSRDMGQLVGLISALAGHMSQKIT